MGLLDKRHGGGLRPPPNPNWYVYDYVCEVGMVCMYV